MVLNGRFPNAVPIRSGVVILTLVIVAAVGARPQAQELATLEAWAATPEPSRPSNWPRLHLPDPVGYQIVRKTLDLAWDRLAKIDCADVLNAFTDGAGRPLDERLRELAVDRQTYLTMIVFIDGSREEPCMKGSFAFTTPGSRVVRLCAEELKRTWQTSPQHAVSRVIHEMLHTLGLGENPPSSADITRRVLDGCGR
jgi:hypothetical protein